jgi:hypothetical protein
VVALGVVGPDHGGVGWGQDRLAEPGEEEEALLAPKLALACFQTADRRWVRDPGQDLPGLVDDSFAALARLTG